MSVLYVHEHVLFSRDLTAKHTVYMHSGLYVDFTSHNVVSIPSTRAVTPNLLPIATVE